ncbi:hypothetical protein [Tenacibaculum phage PTm5]|uniref:Uncharacterized protein n=1 Tax=Tenacibaculum phage PTm5 TaxID=2547426 RepID=A0A5S9BZK8_9CAUD|nr:hypothetical protein [Tenacibaculum phage PTm5]
MKKVTYYFATQLKDVDNKFQEAQVSIPSTSLHFDDIEKLLTHSGIAKNLLSKKEYTYTQGTSFDEYELVE